MKEEEIYISVYREALKEELAGKTLEEKIKLPLSPEFLKKLFFDKEKDKSGTEYYSYSSGLESIKECFDYSDVSFDDVNVEDYCFSEMQGVKINPQTIYQKSLFGARCNNVEFIGPFDNVNVRYTDFEGSKGAIINPQTIKDKSLHGTYCSDVKFLNDNSINLVDIFEDVSVQGTDFTNSIGAVINPQTISGKSMKACIFDSVIFIGPFDGVEVDLSSFAGSKDAKINPQTIASMKNVNCCDVTFYGSFAGHEKNMANLNLNGSNYSYECRTEAKNQIKQLVRECLLKR